MRHAERRFWTISERCRWGLRPSWEIWEARSREGRNSASFWRAPYIADRPFYSSTKRQSHLDEETEAVVAEALRELHITRVIIAHRPATIAHADTILQLTACISRASRISKGNAEAGLGKAQA